MWTPGMFTVICEDDDKSIGEASDDEWWIGP